MRNVPRMIKVRSFTHVLDRGWSVDPLPAMDGDHTLLLLFGGAAYRQHPEVLESLSRAFPQAVKIGCSSAGEIDGDTIHDDSLVVTVLQFSETTLRLATTPIDATHSQAAGEALAAQLLDSQDGALRAVFLLSDGLQVNGTALVAGLSEQLGKDVMVTGGLAGDGDRFAQSWIWCGDSVESGRAVAVGLYGDALICAHGSYGGWRAFGPERRITRAQGNVLYTLDDQPALDLYQRYLGEYAADLPASGLLFPLAIRSEQGDEQVVRTILAIDEEARSITFAGTMPEGDYAQLMSASFDQLIDGANRAAQQLLTTMRASTQAGVLIAISCVGRRLLLGERAEEELEAVLEAMQETTRKTQPLVGFYSYGEISPDIREVGCSLKNQTMTLTWLSER